MPRRSAAMRLLSELFTSSTTAFKLANALAKLPLKLSLSYYRPQRSYYIRRINKLRMEEIGTTTVQLNLNFTHASRHTRVLARLTRVKLQKLACAHTVARNFGVRTRASEHTRHTRNAHHKLALGLPHYMRGVTTGTVAVGNEMQLFCS